MQLLLQSKQINWEVDKALKSEMNRQYTLFISEVN